MLTPEPLLDFPSLPKEFRPRTLFVRRSLDPVVVKELKKKGWEVRDVRVLDRHDSLMGLLEGIRVGSIDVTRLTENRQFYELEAKILGLIGNKDAAPSDTSVKREQTVSELLGEVSEDLEATQVSGKFKPKRRKGRPSKAIKEILNES